MALIFNKCTCVPFVSINLNSMSECDYFSTWGTVLCVCVCVCVCVCMAAETTSPLQTFPRVAAAALVSPLGVC